MLVFSALPEVGWVSAKNVNKLTKSGKVSLVIPCMVFSSGEEGTAFFVFESLVFPCNVKMWNPTSLVHFVGYSPQAKAK